jgi:hypothetical protein
MPDKRDMHKSKSRRHARAAGPVRAGLAQQVAALRQTVAQVEPENEPGEMTRAAAGRHRKQNKSRH